MSAIEYSMQFDQLPLSRRLDVHGTQEVRGALKKSKKAPEPSTLTHNGVDFIDPDTGMTPLLIAAMQGKQQIVRVLIDRGAEIEFQEPAKKRTALILAAKHGRVECIEELMRRGALVNKADKFDMTPLMHASKGGFYSCVTTLVSRAAGLNNTDDQGMTALHFAAKFGHVPVIEHLYECGASLEIRDVVEGKTPLHYAAQYGRKETVLCLLQRGAKINRRTTIEKATALMLASKEGHKSTVSLLIEKGADSNLVDIFGWSPLHFAASWGRRDTALILIVEGKADVNSREDTAKGEGGTPPLTVASRGEQLQLVKLLLNYGADPNLCELVTGNPPLAAAALVGLPDVLQVLMDYGADINYKNVLTGTTALMLSCATGRRGAIVTLLNNYADINILDHNSWTALMHATKSGHRDTLMSAVPHLSPSAKVNMLPWIELECPAMVRGSMGGSPSVFLNSVLYLHKGLYHGLMHIPHDSDVYLVYCLVMLCSACKRAIDRDRADVPDLRQKLKELDDMLARCVSTRNMCHDQVFTDVFIVGNRPCSTLGAYDIRYFGSAFFIGPLALYMQNNLSTFLNTPQMLSKIDRAFWSCLKEPGPEIGKYGNRTSLLHARYCPALMFLFEGIGKLLLLVVIAWNSTVTKSSNVYLRDTSRTIHTDFDTSERIVILMMVSIFIYELGLMEEKRWAIPASIVFNFKELERTRLRSVWRHFVEDPWRFCDLLTCLFGLIWVGIAFYMRGAPQNLVAAVGERFLICSVVPLCIGLLRYPAALFPKFGVQILTIFLVVRDFWNFLLIYIMSGLGFGIVFYGVFRGELSSFDTPLRSLQSLFDAVLKNYDSELFEGSGNHALGVMMAFVFLIWSVVVLFNGLIAHSASNYSMLSAEAEKWWALIKARHVRQFILALEKSPLCMLPPPLNLVTGAAYPFHVYYAWRAKLYSKRMYCISLGGTVSDYVLSGVLLLPTALYEYLMRILSADIGEGNKLLLIILAPLGLLYCISCLLLKLWREPVRRLIVKTRISDGRLRVSYGAKRDSWENESLARFEDERMYKFLGNFSGRKYDVDEDDKYESEDGLSDDRSYYSEAGSRGGRSSRSGRSAGRSRSTVSGDYHYEDDADDEDNDDDAAGTGTAGGGEAKHPYDSLDRIIDDNISKVSSSQGGGGFFGGVLSHLSSKKTKEKVRQREAAYMGKKTRVTPYSPFLQLGSVNEIERVQKGTNQSKLPPRYRRSMAHLMELQRNQHGQMQVRARKVNDSVAGKPGTSSIRPEEQLQRPPVAFLDDGTISPYQPGFENRFHVSQFKHHQDMEYDVAEDLRGGVAAIGGKGRPRTQASMVTAGVGEGDGEGRGPGAVTLLEGRGRFLDGDSQYAHEGDSALVLYDNGHPTVGASAAPAGAGSPSRPGTGAAGAAGAMVPAQTASREFLGSSQQNIGISPGGVGPFPGAVGLQNSPDDLVGQVQAGEDLQQMERPSIYFHKNKFPPIFLEHERRAIFQVVIPEEFVDDFTATVRDTEEYLQATQQKMGSIERKLELQSLMLQKLLQNMG